MSARDYWDTLADRTKYKKRFENCYRAHNLDVLLTPGTALPAHTHGTFGDIALAVCYLSIYNVLDWASGCIPITTVNAKENNVYVGTGVGDSTDQKGQIQMRDALGMPIGVQIAAPSGKEEMVLRVMGEIEEIVQFRTKFEAKGMEADVFPSRM